MHCVAMPEIHLAVEDAVELLSFLHDWLGVDAAAGASLAEFVGHPAYSAIDLRADLDRFAFLLGGNDGERMLSADGR